MSSLRAQSLYDLSGRVAVVTGGGTGIGLMIAKGLAANGAKVYITGRRAEVLQKVADETSKEDGEIVPLPMDVTDKKSILEAKKVLQEKEGKLHILVNNAGQVGPVSPFMSNPDAPELKSGEAMGNALFQEDFAGWGQLYSINVFPIFFVTTALLGLLENGSQDIPTWTSSVINITSISGVIKQAQDHFCYNSAKAAASHLTKLLSTELHIKKIPVRVNAVSPGVYASEMTFAPMSSSCQGLLAALKDCIMHSDCVIKQGNLPSVCLREHVDELPEQCQSLRKATFECKRGMLDMRKRFRGNIVGSQFEYDATPEASTTSDAQIPPTSGSA